MPSVIKANKILRLDKHPARENMADYSLWVNYEDMLYYNKGKIE
jgi:hypothetical protein